MAIVAVPRNFFAELARNAVRPFRRRAFVVPSMMVVLAVALDIGTTLLQPHLEWSALYEGLDRENLLRKMLSFAMFADFLVVMILYFVMSAAKCVYSRFGVEFFRIGKNSIIYDTHNVVTLIIFATVSVSLIRFSGFANNIMVLVLDYGFINMAKDLGLSGWGEILMFVVAGWSLFAFPVAAWLTRRLTNDGLLPRCYSRNDAVTTP